jgi:uncharacterized membrane protein HdeD (DUF308 family)
MTTDVSKEVKKGLNWSIGIGFLLILLGILAIAFPFFSALAVEVWIAWIILFGGVGKLIYAVQTRSERGFIWKFLLSILYITTGMFLLFDPLEGILSLTLTLGIFLLIEGLFESIFAFQVRPQSNWIWLLSNGITTLLLGGLIWLEWPLSGEFAIGLLVGISLIFSGFSRILLSVAIRSSLNFDNPHA